jgi:hypothetical protein
MLKNKMEKINLKYLSKKSKEWRSNLIGKKTKEGWNHKKKKSILKTTSNKINNNKKYEDPNWQMKKN